MAAKAKYPIHPMKDLNTQHDPLTQINTYVSCITAIKYSSFISYLSSLLLLTLNVGTNIINAKRGHAELVILHAAAIAIELAIIDTQLNIIVSFIVVLRSIKK